MEEMESEMKKLKTGKVTVGNVNNRSSVGKHMFQFRAIKKDG